MQSIAQTIHAEIKAFKGRILFIGLMVLISACKGSSTAPSPIPYVYVYETIFLNSSSALNLRIYPYWIYWSGGNKGLIIYNNAPTVGNNYLAFDRLCTYNIATVCAPIIVNSSGFYMADTCKNCRSSFDWTGQPTSGPASIRLLQYSTVVNGNQLIITN